MRYFFKPEGGLAVYQLVHLAVSGRYKIIML